MPNSSQLAVSTSSCLREMGSATGLSTSVVGTLWSAVATVRSGRRTPRPARRRPSKAWGEVTSWTRCRSMNKRSGSPGVLRTTWESQTLSKRVRGASATSVTHLHDDHPERAGGRLVLDRLAGLVPEERHPERRARGHHAHAVLVLLDGADEEALHVVLVVALVAEGDGGAGGDRSVPAAGLDQLHVLQQRRELADARLHLPLGVLGG